MKVKIDGGFIEARRQLNKIWIAVGCEHFNADGTRKDTVINAVEITEDEFLKLCEDLFEKPKEIATTVPDDNTD